MAEPHLQEEHLDVLTKSGGKTGVSKPRRDIHRDGDYHRAVHVWIFAESTQELLLQKRADCKDSWPGLWDISSAGHISAGDSSLITAQRELHEELGLLLPRDAFELIFIFLEECITNGGKFINNEYSDVYLVTTLDPIPLEAFTLQDTEVSNVKYISYEEYRSRLAKEDAAYVPYDVNKQYGLLFDIIRRRYKVNTEARSLALQKQLHRYAPVSLTAELTENEDGSKIEMFRKNHWNESKSWINFEAETRYNMMVEIRDTQPGLEEESSSIPQEEDSIIRTVLGKTTRFVPRIGPAPHKQFSRLISHPDPQYLNGLKALQDRLDDKESVISELQQSLKNQGALIAKFLAQFGLEEHPFMDLSNQQPPLPPPSSAATTTQSAFSFQIINCSTL